MVLPAQKPFAGASSRARQLFPCSSVMPDSHPAALHQSAALGCHARSCQSCSVRVRAPIENSPQAAQDIPCGPSPQGGARATHRLNTLRCSRMDRNAARFSRRHVKRTFVPPSAAPGAPASPPAAAALLAPPPSPGAGSAGAVTPGGMSQIGTWRPRTSTSAARQTLQIAPASSLPAGSGRAHAPKRMHYIPGKVNQTSEKGRGSRVQGCAPARKNGVRFPTGQLHALKQGYQQRRTLKVQPQTCLASANSHSTRAPAASELLLSWRRPDSGVGEGTPPHLGLSVLAVRAP